MSRNSLQYLQKQLDDKNARLLELEQDLNDKAEELSSQREELTAAIEELVEKNNSLVTALTQLRERNFELDQILYRTSHDLRSPITSIKGILSLLKLEPQSDTIQQYGQHIEDKVGQMDNLLRSLSSLSKSILEEPVLAIVNLHRIIWQVLDELKQVPSRNNMEIKVSLEVEKIETDPLLMTIIFQSLLSNAFIFRDPIKKGIISILAYQEKEMLSIEVRDDGEGIPPLVLPHIFDLFYRGSERSAGNGLGLYVAKKASERLQGNVTVTPEPDNTCFTVTIPLAT